jgi:hypothetical protein
MKQRIAWPGEGVCGRAALSIDWLFGTQLPVAHIAPAFGFYFTSDKVWQRRYEQLWNQFPTEQ